MALKSTQHLIIEYQWSKGGWCLGLTTMPPPCVDYVEILEASTLAMKEPVKACIWIAYLYLNLHRHRSENFKSRRTKDVENKEVR